VLRRSAFVLGTLGALAVADRASAQNALVPVRVGCDTGWEYSEAWFAQDEGFFTKAGLSAELTSLSSGAAISAAVASGQLDVGVASLVPLAIARGRGLPFVIVAGGALATPNVTGAAVCVAKNGPIRSAVDLEGKTVAVNALKNFAEMMLDAWLAQHGVDPAKVQVVELRFTEMAGAAERGQVAAAVLSEPALTPALATGNFRSLGDVFTAVPGSYLISSWFTTTGFLERNPDVVRRFRSAIYDAARWANTHPDESADVNAKYSKMDPQVLRKMVRRPYATDLRPAQVQPILDIGARYGVTSKSVTTAELLGA